MNQDLERRVRKLERTNRFWQALVLVLASAFLLGAYQGAEEGPLRARRIELVNDAGEVQAFLGTDKEGSTGLFINDPEGGLRLSLTHDKDQSALFVRDDEGVIRVGVAQFAHGGGGFALHGPNSKGAAVLYLKGAGSLSFFDQEGKVTTRIPELKE